MKTKDDIHAAIRSVGGIIHRDGNIFFTNSEKFVEAVAALEEQPVLSHGFTAWDVRLFTLIDSYVDKSTDGDGDEAQEEYDALKAHLKTRPVPVMTANFEVESASVVGSTNVPVKRVEAQDDGTFTVVLDYWPTPANHIPATPEEKELAREQYAAGSDDDIKVDEDAASSLDPETGNVWVQAWVYVRKFE